MSKDKARENYLPYSIPFIQDDEIKEVVDTLKSGWVAKGPKTMKFEKEFSEFVGAKHAIAVNSATAALHLALIAAGIGPGDEVITTPMTFASTANTIIHAGAKPVFADIDPETHCIDPEKIKEKITSRTKAIVPVHYSGQACDMDKIWAIAKKHNLFVSEDAAHALYTRYKGNMIGKNGDSASYSFYATKNICTGDGGMLTTNRDDIAEKARVLSSQGMTKAAWNRYGKGGSWKYDIEYAGFKYNMFDIQAALGLRQLSKIEIMQKRREEIAMAYEKAFDAMPEIIAPKPAPYTKHCWHLYVIRVREELLTIDRDQFIDELSEENIGTSVHFIPVHLMSYYRNNFGYKEGDFPETESYFKNIISLPLYAKMTDEDIEDVIYAIKRIVDKYRK